MIITYDYHVLKKIMGIMKSGMHVFQYFLGYCNILPVYGLSHVNRPFNFFPYQNYLRYCIILIFVIFIVMINCRCDLVRL